MVGPIRDSNASVFKPPPRDVALEFVFDFHLRENSNYPVVIFPTTENGTCVGSYIYREFVPAIHRVGQWISNDIGFRPTTAASGPAPVVVVLLKTDAMTSLTVIAGLMRAGVIAFPISPRFSSTVIAHLLETSQPKAIIFDIRTQLLAKTALEEYTKGRADSPLLCEVPSFSSFFPGHDTYDALPMYERQPGDISIMTHSSSSSSLYPKVVSWSSSIVTHHGENKARQLSGQVLGGFGLEIFHSMGLVVLFTMVNAYPFYTVRQGLILGIMDPTKQTSILPADPSDIFRCFQLTQPNLFLTNPRALELWTEDSEKVAVLRESDADIIYGGRFLSKTVGDKLVQSGVKIRAGYGSTETGPIALLPHFQGSDWEYWTVCPRADVNFIPRDDGLLELIVIAPDERTPLPITNTKWDGKLAFNPGDLFIAHPKKQLTYKMFGRSSDQIMLATGEMVNPVEIETELSKHPLILSAVMFGHTRSSVGIVIEPSVVGQEKSLSKEAFIDEIWHIIDTLNQKSPSYTSISRKMIILASAEKPISISPKGLPRRPIVWHEYENEIDGVYAKEWGIQI